jgi:hypothetical protein
MRLRFPRLQPKTIAISAQLNAGDRRSSKGGTERYKGCMALAVKVDQFRNRSRPTMVLLSRHFRFGPKGRSAQRSASPTFYNVATNVGQLSLPLKISVLNGPDRPILAERYHCDRASLKPDVRHSRVGILSREVDFKARRRTKCRKRRAIAFSRGQQRRRNCGQLVGHRSSRRYHEGHTRRGSG